MLRLAWIKKVVADRKTSLAAGSWPGALRAAARATSPDARHMRLVTVGRTPRPTTSGSEVGMGLVRESYKGIVAVAVALALVSSLTVASAFNPRVPQFPVLGGTLQGYLNGVGEAIYVMTDQLDAQVWTTSA